MNCLKSKCKTINKFFQGVFIFLYKKLIESRSTNELQRKREFILNILLNSVLTLFIAAFLINLVRSSTAPEAISTPPLYLFIIVLLFSLLLHMSCKGLSKIAANIFLGFFYIFISISMLQWGIDLPQGLLAFALLIIIAGILINTRFAFFFASLISLSISLIYYLHKINIFNYDSHWRLEFADTGDIIVYSGTLMVMAIISWLYNKELENSLNRALHSEATLQKERDQLEITVEERTKELKEAQLKVMAELYKSAEFGRMASGLIHDTTNHLNALALNIEVLDTIEDKEKAKIFIEGALNSSKKLMDYVKAVHKQLRHETPDSLFNLKNETDDAISILDYKAKRFNIEIENLSQTDYQLFGNSLKFNQIITNLISNAIDAYENYESENKKIEINIKQHNGHYIISVQDWGKGIPQEILGKIFDPFFTTKDMYKGSGIGLANILQIIEKDFDGEIKLQSTVNFGTTFIIKLPIKTNAEKSK